MGQQEQQKGRPRVMGATPGFLRDKGVLVEEGAGGTEWHPDTQHPESTEGSRASTTAMLEKPLRCSEEPAHIQTPLWEPTVWRASEV